MSLITVAYLQELTDKFAFVYDEMITQLGIATGSAVVGTHRKVMDNALAILTTSVADYEQQIDMASQVYTASTKMNNKEVARAAILPALAAVREHIELRGSSVAATIVSLDTYLAYYNGGVGGVAYSSMLHPSFNRLWYDLFTERLTQVGFFHPGVHPTLDSAYTNGFGTKTVAGVFTAGYAYDATTSYFEELTPLVEVTTTFTGGAAAPTISVAGTDDSGATSTTWTATLTGNNPAAAVSTTITPAVTAGSRQTVAVASATGIVVGSVLTVNSGLVDQEVVVVEAVSGSDLTMVFRKAHAGGAALTGNTTAALTPSVGTRRIRSVSGITIGLTSHSAGTVRIVGKQDRVAKNG